VPVQIAHFCCGEVDMDFLDPWPRGARSRVGRSMRVAASQFDGNLALWSGRVIEADGHDAQFMLSAPARGPSRARRDAR
jgi:hypothetical protein